MMIGENLNFEALIKDKLRDALKERGHVNILIAGRSGVGKSTLVNAIFQGNLATTGQGRPVTQNTREIKKEGVPLSIFDTRGLEMADFSKTVGDVRSFVSERARNTDPKQHIHVAWICIAEDLRRVEPAEEELVKVLADYMPVKVDINLKKTQSHAIVATAATSAAGIAAVPIPFSDAIAIVPIQVGMLAGISATFGLSIDESFLSTIVGSIVTGAGGTLAGRAILSGLLKFIPGIGSVAGGAIAATTAAALTTAFGEAYIAALEMLFMNNNGEPPTSDKVAKAFKEQYLQFATSK